MKKYRIISIALVLSLLLSCSALALGNDFTFSQNWYHAVLLRSSFRGTFADGVNSSFVFSDYPYNFHKDTLYCSTSVAGFIGGLSNPSPYCYIAYYNNQNPVYDNTLKANFDISTPMGVLVRAGQTFNFQSMLFLEM